MLYVIGGPSSFFVDRPVYDAPYLLLVGFPESVDEFVVEDKSRADPYFLTGSFFEAVVSYLEVIFSLDAEYFERAVAGVVVFSDDKLPVRLRVDPYFGVVIVDVPELSFDVVDLYLDVCGVDKSFSELYLDVVSGSLVSYFFAIYFMGDEASLVSLYCVVDSLLGSDVRLVVGSGG